MDRRMETPEQAGTGISRDMPDQEAGTEREDRWAASRDSAVHRPGTPEDVPDTDVPGSGRSGDGPRPAVHPDQPDPDEPAD
ncbi:hypothetical protein ACFV3R_09040 [Streptomyces sp. NPDC059740]|uniref:hypothetical protein n=1 Tax=Streptomyces sp. NPDC059740 TaxID=3346926 RepID=UPI003649D6F7